MYTYHEVSITADSLIGGRRRHCIRHLASVVKQFTTVELDFFYRYCIDSIETDASFRLSTAKRSLQCHGVI